MEHVTHSVEYPKTPGHIKRRLRALRVTQSQAALAIGKSPAMVSMVLNRKAKSQPILDQLGAFIVRKGARRPRRQGRAA
jgi:hypothetical protein